MTDISILAHREVANVLSKAIRLMDIELAKPAPRLPVTYSNGVTVNTRSRAALRWQMYKHPRRMARMGINS